MIRGVYYCGRCDYTWVIDKANVGITFQPFRCRCEALLLDEERKRIEETRVKEFKH